MNSYEEKQEAKKEYYQRKAEQARKEYEQRHDQADKISNYIPFGQPILVGHHSEKRHRRDIEKIQNNMDKAIDAAKKADYYEQKAKSVGKGGISSDDPDAIKKLKAKLEKLQAKQEYMKKINRIHRAYKKHGIGKLEGHDLSQAEKEKIINYKPAYSWEPNPFAPFQLKNNNANIRSTKKRIEKIQAQSKREHQEVEHEGFTLVQNVEANRIQIFFSGKPSKEIRDILKSHGFRWAPSNKAWQRQLTNAGIYAAKEAAKEIEKGQ